MAEVEHLVQHHVGQPFDFGDAVADLADDADGLLGRGGLGAGDLGFDFLDQVSHDRLSYARCSQARRRSPPAWRARCRRRRRCRPGCACRAMSAGFSSNDVSSPVPYIRARLASTSSRRSSGAASRFRRRPCAGRDPAAPALEVRRASPSAPRRPDAATRAATCRTRAASSRPSTRQSRNRCARVRLAFRVDLHRSPQLPGGLLRQPPVIVRRQHLAGDRRRRLHDEPADLAA